MSYISVRLLQEKYGSILKEIGKIVNPYSTSFRLIKKQINFETSFKDHEDNLITVKFERYSRNSFNVGFDVNGSTKQFKVSSPTHLLRIISTVVLVIKQFIKEQDPDVLLVTGDDKLGVEGRDFTGQKNRMYKAYVGNILDDGNHIIEYPKGNSNSDDVEIRKITDDNRKALAERNAGMDIWLQQHYDRIGQANPWIKRN